MDVVVVESPAKAKTINKYLGKGFTVLASYGHVRDLPAKNGSVQPDHDFSMSWEVDERSQKRIDDIAAALRQAEHLYLATDPDREGEAISWHVEEALRQSGAIGSVDVKRVVFHEITRDAVLQAIAHPRSINRELVEAYLARRALDYLVGFTLSPVLWRKLPGAKSAGRVQSVALRLISEREAEIEAFDPQEYWTVDVDLRTAESKPFSARLTHLDGAKLAKLDLRDEAAAKRAVAAIEGGRFTVEEVERKQVKRNPYPPFTTSTLQQEASRKLRFGASKTMRTAQRLYEGVDIGGETVGLITYMRTDSVTLSGEAMSACRRWIAGQHGDRYLPDKPRVYKTKTKNAQEAHEAIRPTDVFRTPKDMARHLDADQARLYELVWKRTMASQMAQAILEQVGVQIAAQDGRSALRATGSVVVFDGFFALYREGHDDGDDDDRERILPPMERGQALERGDIRPEQHFTQPPPRFTEASLVKKLEELGIGRPSTYASIIQVLQDRAYVKLENRRFVPEDRGRLVTSFLKSFFHRYIEYDFTADLEDKLDDVSNGRIDWKQLLSEFWQAFSQAVDGTKDLTITQVLEALDAELGQHFFPPQEDGSDPRKCPSCGDGRLSLRLGKYGAFLGCSNYPDCKFSRPLSGNGNGNGAVANKVLGSDPDSGVEISLRAGPYGPYVQLGEANGDDKPKRVPIPKTEDPAAIDLEKARQLLSLPRKVGDHPTGGETIYAGIGRYGPYLRQGRSYASLQGLDDVLTIGLNRAVTLLDEAKSRKTNGALRSLGAHPGDGKDITVHSGRYGPYVKHGRTNASLPKDVSAEAVTLDQAVALIDARKAKTKGKARKAAPRKKTATKSAKKSGSRASRSADN